MEGIAGVGFYREDFLNTNTEICGSSGALPLHICKKAALRLIVRVQAFRQETDRKWMENVLARTSGSIRKYFAVRVGMSDYE